MRQTHLGGDRMFVNYARDTVPVVVNRLTGEIRKAHIFVAVMGASSLSFAWASGTESLPDWVDAHIRAFGHFGGSARLLIPDNAYPALEIHHAAVPEISAAILRSCIRTRP